MAILRPFLQPTVGEPHPVVAPPRRNPRLRQKPHMGQAQFYEQMLESSKPVTVTREEQQRLQGGQDVQGSAQHTPVGEKFVDAPVTGDYLTAQLARIQGRDPAPQLRPGERVRSPNLELVQPSAFRRYYEMLNLQNQIGQEQLATEQVKSQNRAQQALMDILSRQPPAFQGVQLDASGMPIQSSSGGGAMPAPTNTTGVKRTVQQLAAQRYGWSGAQWNALHELIQRESGWRPNAANPTSSARGLFQKMTSLHGPIEPTVQGQAIWGLNYIKNRYGTPAAALAHWKRRVPINGKDVGHWY